MFLLVGADRNHRSIAYGVGVFPEESAKNYKAFFSMPMKVPEIAAVLNCKDKRCAIIHDRHLSLKPSTAACFPELLDRVDPVHLIRNIIVSSLFIYIQKLIISNDGYDIETRQEGRYW
jgi:hypothetical protein